MYTVSLNEFIKKMKVVNLTPEVDIENIEITQTDTNRPALQLADFFDYFDNHRVQIIGQVEYTYMEKIGVEKSAQMLGKIMSYKVPCIVFCRDLPVAEEYKKVSKEMGIPILRSDKDTSSFSAECTRWLKVKLAPRISIHGVLVDIYGEGVLITGESGIGKSEVALELIHRGHRLVSDDVVEIKKISDAELIGSAPEITRHFIELRGIGIIDAKTLFGVESVKNNQKIDLVINRIRIDMVRRGEMMSTEDVLDILAVNLLGAVPDEESVVIAANHGESLIGSNTLAGQAFLNIARRLDGETVPLLDLQTSTSLFQKIASVFKGRQSQ